MYGLSFPCAFRLSFSRGGRGHSSFFFFRTDSVIFKFGKVANLMNEADGTNAPPVSDSVISNLTSQFAYYE